MHSIVAKKMSPVLGGMESSRVGATAARMPCVVSEKRRRYAVVMKGSADGVISGEWDATWYVLGLPLDTAEVTVETRH